MRLDKGDLVELGNGRICVIVGVESDANIPEGHVAAWFGEMSEDGSPIVWTAPAEYFTPVQGAVEYRH